MIKLFDRQSTRLTISEFYENHQAKKYVYDVPYQRESGVWSGDSSAFLIDSIFKNYPMPAIFMKSHVDTKTGKTMYDVVDGKQRLETILAFINDEFTLTDYFADDSIFIEPILDTPKDISGLKFSEIKNKKEFEPFVKQFWTYTLDIEYLYEDSPDIIANVFDRLNRGGERLRGQELRNAKYHSSGLLQTIRNLSKLDFWAKRYSQLDTVRMEEQEFISELFFLVAEKKVMESSQKVLDAMYKKYDEQPLDDHIAIFEKTTLFIESLNLDYKELKRLDGTTHLYGLFAFSWHCCCNGISAQFVQEKISNLYKMYFRGDIEDIYLIEYKKSCSSGTRGRAQRNKRLKSMLKYCGL